MLKILNIVLTVTEWHIRTCRSFFLHIYNAYDFPFVGFVCVCVLFLFLFCH